MPCYKTLIGLIGMTEVMPCYKTLIGLIGTTEVMPCYKTIENSKRNEFCSSL